MERSSLGSWFERTRHLPPWPARASHAFLPKVPQAPKTDAGTKDSNTWAPGRHFTSKQWQYPSRLRSSRQEILALSAVLVSCLLAVSECLTWTVLALQGWFWLTVQGYNPLWQKSHSGGDLRSHCIHSQLAFFLSFIPLPQPMDGTTHSQNGSLPP